MDCHAGAYSEAWLRSRSITVGSTTVTPVHAVRDLGIYIDCGLTVQAHVAKMHRAVSRFFDEFAIFANCYYYYYLYSYTANR